MDIDGAAVHSVAGGVLDIPIGTNDASIQISAQGVPGYAVDNDFLAAQAAADVALANTVFDVNFFIFRIENFFV